MKALLLTTLLIIALPYAIYRFYTLIIVLHKQKKYGKSKELIEWQINQDPISRFFRYGFLKKIEMKGYDYKILKEQEDELKN